MLMVENKDEFKKELEDMKIAFNKEFEVLNAIIKEEIGENNIHFFRLQMITELIEKDVKELTDIFSQIIEISNKAESTLNTAHELQTKIMKDKGMTDINAEIDPLSEIVKDLSKLDEKSKRYIMYYVSGYSSVSKQKT